MSGKGMDAGGAVMLVPEIVDNGALSSANLLRNTIPVEQARELVDTMQSKKKLTTLCGLSGKETTLDFSNQGLGPGDAVLIANDISDMGTLSTLIFGGDEYWDGRKQKHVTPEPATLQLGMTEADFSNKGLQHAGAIIVASWITHKDMGAMSKLTFGDKQVVTMTTDMTEANFSGKLESHEAQIVAAFLPKCT
jgi:hypothetical protein